jgi:uncharacterized protein
MLFRLKNNEYSVIVVAKIQQINENASKKHDFLAVMRKKAIFALQNEDKTHRRRMDYQTLIQQYYPQDDSLRSLLLLHSQQVANRCLNICDRHPELHLDRAFLDEAAMLHDIGIRWCHAPAIFCTGEEPYVCHGLIGGKLLRQVGLIKHAQVCERHTGAGITVMPTSRDGRPLLPADWLQEGLFVPQSLEEQVVCYADKFYSKSHPERELTVDQAAQSLERFGRDGVERFLSWADKFE